VVQVSARPVCGALLVPEPLDAGLLVPELELEPSVVDALMTTEAVVGVPKSASPVTEVSDTPKLLAWAMLLNTGIEIVCGAVLPSVQTSEPVVGKYSAPEVAVPLTVV
jgi:hypothetical protein